MSLLRRYRSPLVLAVLAALVLGVLAALGNCVFQPAGGGYVQAQAESDSACPQGVCDRLEAAPDHMADDLPTAPQGKLWLAVALLVLLLPLRAPQQILRFRLPPYLLPRRPPALKYCVLRI